MLSYYWKIKKCYYSNEVKVTIVPKNWFQVLVQAKNSLIYLQRRIICRYYYKVVVDIIDILYCCVHTFVAEATCRNDMSLKRRRSNLYILRKSMYRFERLSLVCRSNFSSDLSRRQSLKPVHTFCRCRWSIFKLDQRQIA